MSYEIDPARIPVPRARSGYIAAFFEFRPATFSLILILLILVVSLLAPVFTPYERDTIDLDNILADPSCNHVLGTDELGRDVFTRLIYGGRFTLLVALLSVAIAVVLGVALGAAAGYLGGPADHFVTGAVDMFLSIPVFLVLLVAASAGGGRLWTIPVIIGVTSWMETARLVRAEFLSLRDENFVEAARSLGVRHITLVIKHILPHALPPVIVAATVGFAQAMLIESALSFLGFGVQPPLPTWGNMLQNAQTYIRKSHMAAFAPGFMILVTCLCFNFVGEGLRSALAREKRSL
ncbi:MAG: ABC transporter permease [Candidatus Krumholzibacteria bacterium]|nr:ABC transporter permease [Candidatus Krumholzibacteria bacterium]